MIFPYTLTHPIHRVLLPVAIVFSSYLLACSATLTQAHAADNHATNNHDVSSHASLKSPTATTDAALIGLSPEAAVHQEEVLAWRKMRDQRLRSPTGWLTLAGLFWLSEGHNKVGSDATFTIVLPNTVATHVGDLELISNPNGAGKNVFFHWNPETPPLLEDPISTESSTTGILPNPIPLSSDSDEAPTVVSYGAVQFFVIQRGGRLGVRVKDKASDVLKEFTGIDNFPVDLAWQVSARFQPYPAGQTLAVPNVLGAVTQETVAGALFFEHAGKSYSLEALGEPGDTQLFIIFGDASNRITTYGAGRFLIVDLPEEGSLDHAEVVIDFNRAYNPACAFTRFATCPLPPKKNRLPFAVNAGEKSYGKHK